MELPSKLKLTFRSLVIVLLVALVVIELLRLVVYMRINAKVSRRIEQRALSILHETEKTDSGLPPTNEQPVVGEPE